MAGKFAADGSSLAAAADLATAWRDRLEDARSLLAADRYAASISYGLYAVEIRLKSLVCGRLDLERLPKEFEIHDLNGLLTLAGLSRTILSRPAVVKSWNDLRIVSQDINDLRYLPASRFIRPQAEAFFRTLDDPVCGVMTWLSTL